MTANVVGVSEIHRVPPPRIVTHAEMIQFTPRPPSGRPAAYLSTHYKPRATVIIPSSPPALMPPAIAYKRIGLSAASAIVLGGSKKLYKPTSRATVYTPP